MDLRNARGIQLLCALVKGADVFVQNFRPGAAERMGIGEEALRAVRPDISVSTDIIVGFPGETEADFQATMDLAAELGFDQSFSFVYSARPGTPAAALPDPVPHEEKLYTWWSYRAKDWSAADKGRRLDHIWLDGNLADKCARIEVVREARGWEKPSDLIGNHRAATRSSANASNAWTVWIRHRDMRSIRTTFETTTR